MVALGGSLDRVRALLIQCGPLGDGALEIAMDKKFKVTFELDEQDAAYFRDLYRQAKQNAAKLDADSDRARTRASSSRSVRQLGAVPRFVVDAIATLEDMTQIIQDEEYKAPQAVKNQVLAGLAYFANPEDLIPDHVPGARLPRRRDHGQVRRGGVQARALGLPQVPRPRRARGATAVDARSAASG